MYQQLLVLHNSHKNTVLRTIVTSQGHNKWPIGKRKQYFKKWPYLLWTTTAQQTHRCHPQRIRRGERRWKKLGCQGFPTNTNSILFAFCKNIVDLRGGQSMTPHQDGFSSPLSFLPATPSSQSGTLIERFWADTGPFKGPQTHLVRWCWNLTDIHRDTIRKIPRHRWK